MPSSCTVERIRFASPPLSTPIAKHRPASSANTDRTSSNSLKSSLQNLIYILQNIHQDAFHQSQGPRTQGEVQCSVCSGCTLHLIFVLQRTKVDLAKQLNDLRQELLTLRVQKIAGGSASKLTKMYVFALFNGKKESG